MEPTHNNEEIVIDLRELFVILISKLGIILLSGITLGLVTIIGTKLFITPQYQSTTKMYVLAKQDNSTLTSGDMQTSTLLTKDYAELIVSRTVTEQVIAQLGLDMDHDELTNKLDITTPTDTRIVTISVKDADPYVARDIADAVRDTAAEHIQAVMETEAVNVAEQANIPAEPVSPSILRNGLIGFILGIFLVVAVVLVVYLMNDTVKTSEDVEQYLQLSTLGTIPLREDEKKKKRKVRGKKSAARGNK